MSFPTPKELKKLAAACRKAGIKSFKTPTFEFTLEDAPEPIIAKAPVAPGDPTSDAPSEEELLFWSVGGPIREYPEGTIGDP